jgi:hypothetical protein
MRARGRWPGRISVLSLRLHAGRTRRCRERERRINQHAAKRTVEVVRTQARLPLSETGTRLRPSPGTIPNAGHEVPEMLGMRDGLLE